MTNSAKIGTAQVIRKAVLKIGVKFLFSLILWSGAAKLFFSRKYKMITFRALIHL